LDFWLPADTAAAPPESRRSLALVPLIGDKRYNGEAPVRPARDWGGLSEDVAGSLIIVIWQQHLKGFSASP
jgi:hypothetical protein